MDNLRASPFFLQYIVDSIPDYHNAVIVAKVRTPLQSFHLQNPPSSLIPFFIIFKLDSIKRKFYAKISRSDNFRENVEKWIWKFTLDSPLDLHIIWYVFIYIYIIYAVQQCLGLGSVSWIRILASWIRIIEIPLFLNGSSSLA